MSPASSEGVLLDTCAVIYLANGDPMAERAKRAVQAAAQGPGVFVSPVSAWEIGLLSRPERPQPVRFVPDPKTWFLRFMAAPGVREAGLTAEIAIDSSHLPPPLHGDPADRLLIATARHLNLPIVTRDRLIRAYADAGHVRVIPC